MLWNAVFCSWLGCHIHEHIAVVVIYTWSIQDQGSQNSGIGKVDVVQVLSFAAEQLKMVEGSLLCNDFSRFMKGEPPYLINSSFSLSFLFILWDSHSVHIVFWSSNHLLQFSLFNAIELWIRFQRWILGNTHETKCSCISFLWTIS